MLIVKGIYSLLVRRMPNDVEVVSTLHTRAATDPNKPNKPNRGTDAFLCDAFGEEVGEESPAEDELVSELGPEVLVEPVGVEPAEVRLAVVPT